MQATAHKQPPIRFNLRSQLGCWIFVLGLLVAACSSTTQGTIGAILGRNQSGRTFVRDVPEYLAAYQAGIRPGDELLFVSGQEVRALSDEQLRQLLGGSIGQEVQLTLVRGETEIIRINVPRSRAEPYFRRSAEK